MKEENKIKTVYLPKEILKDKTLSSVSKLVALHLFHISGWETKSQINNSDFERKLNIKRNKIIPAIKELQEKGYLIVNEDKTFQFFINGVEFSDKKDLANKEVCNMFGDFVRVPTFSLYIDLLTPTQRVYYIMMFEFYFEVEGNWFVQKKRNVYLSSVATYYGINENTFRHGINAIKEIGLIDYKTVKDKNGNKIIGLKTFNATKKWVIENGKEIKTEEVEVKETKIEEDIPEEIDDEIKEELETKYIRKDKEDIAVLEEFNKLDYKAAVYQKCKSFFTKADLVDEIDYLCLNGVKEEVIYERLESKFGIKDL